jgi:hypothetical protein
VLKFSLSKVGLITGATAGRITTVPTDRLLELNCPPTSTISHDPAMPYPAT